MTKIKKTTKAKVSSKDDLYLDIYLPCSEEAVEEEEEKTNFSIPIRKENFAYSQIPSIVQQEPADEEEEYEEAEEIEYVEEPVLEPKKKKANKRRISFSFFKKRERVVKKEKVAKIGKKEEKIKVKNYKPRTSLGFKKKFLTLATAAGVLMVGGVALASFVFNRATINIISEKGSIEYSGKIIVDSSIEASNIDKNIIKGREIKVEASASKEFNATGKVSGGAKARGKIIIYNAFNTSPQILVPNTRFESPDGLIFRLDNRVTVPGGTIKNGDLSKSSIEVTVTAEENGEAYNIDKVRFTIPGFKGTERFDGFYAESVEKFAGGSSGESVVVSEADIQNATKEISEILFTDFKTKIEAQIASHEKTFSDIIVKQVGSPVASAKVGASQDKFTVEIKGEARATVFSKTDYQNVLKNNIAKGLSEDEELFSTPEEAINSIKLNDKEKQVEINLSVSYPTKKKIEASDIFNSVKGKKMNQVKDILLQTKGVEKVTMKLWPF